MICTLIILFTGDEGEAYGYRDGWDETGSGVYNYTGEGQEGDMQFRGGNLAIRDHAANGKDLFLFSTLGKGRPVRFLGRFSCANFETIEGVDRGNAKRKVIVFHLVPMDGLVDQEQLPSQPRTSYALDTLRARAYAAAKTSPGHSGGTASVVYRERSESVKQYVLARARGRCELCTAVAPFQRADESQYLEPHHIRRLSDGGPDHPAYVAALCPNCHREMHHGRDGRSKNAALEAAIVAAEAKYSSTESVS